MSRDNIVDFNSIKGKGGKEVSDDALIAQLSNAIGNMMHSMEKSKLTDRANMLMWDQFARTIVFMEITNNVVGILREQGFDPDNFMPEKRSLDRFMAMSFDGNDDRKLSDDEAFERQIANSWNGPRYDWRLADGSVVRVATTLLFRKGTMTRMSAIVLMLEKNADHWMVWADDAWEDDGPQADFFDIIDSSRDELDDDDEDWDEDELWLTDLDVGLIEILQDAGIHTLDDLASQTERDLLRIRGIGKKRVAKIKAVLKEEGYSLRE